MNSLINWLLKICFPTKFRLMEFFKEWDEWRESGTPKHPHFETFNGLCDSLERWSNRDRKLKDELSELFDHRYFPFGTRDQFFKESVDGTMHLNERRIAFVKQQIGE